MTQVDRLLEDKWVKCPVAAMDKRMDALRKRADFLARKIHMGQQAPMGRDEQEYAALMWALSELAGIGDEVRQRAFDREQMRVGARRDATKRAEHAEALNAQYRVTIQALKAECRELRQRLYPAPAQAPDHGLGEGDD